MSGERYVPPEIAAEQEKFEQKKVVSLERNLPYESNIPYRPDHFYRAMDEVAYEEFQKTGEMNGLKHNALYFQKGFANARYVAHGRIKAIILETDGRAGFIVDESTGYARTDGINAADVTSGKVPVRVWRHQGNNYWEPIFDSFGADS